LKINKLNIVLVLGVVAIAGILVVQLLWMKQAWNVEGKKFSEKVHISLLGTLKRLYSYDNREFPLKNPINKISNDYYIVNVNNDFEAEVLEYCLKTELERAGLITDFEYAIYKCESDEMVYGNYVSFSNKKEGKASMHFPKQENLVYYFAIRFPNESNYLTGSMKLWLGLSCILVLILVIYLYSIFTILQQKKYSNLQRDFIDNMTHEFKTPLSSILIASTYLSKQKAITEDEKLGKYTEIIIDQSKKLNNHLEQVLNIAKWDNAPLILNLEKVELISLLKSVIENIRLKHPALKVEIISWADLVEIVLTDFILRISFITFSTIPLNIAARSPRSRSG
jgi:two-component system, OmpR family, phosphate regulon sensor histidine kinase PhoR